MKRRLNPYLITVFSSALVCGLSLAALDVSAQGSKRKRSTKPKPAATSTPPAGSAEIISRADDVIVVSPPPTVTRTAGTAPESDPTLKALEDLQNRLKALESGNKTDPDQKQKRLSLSLDILTRSEQRAETLRKQLFDMIEKENVVKSRLDVIENDIRPEAIDRSVAFAGSLRPEELRTVRRKNLESERANLQSLLTEIQKNKANLEQNLSRADALVERLRGRLEKDIDTALTDDSDKP